MKKYTLLTLFAVLLLQQSFAQSTIQQEERLSGYKGDFTPEVTLPKDGFTFLALGDFGRVGEYYQKDVAAELGRAAITLDAEFVVSVGDNFYPSGVASTQDQHWKSSFEEIYTHPNLYKDWYAILGNHDYRGSTKAQIDYTQVSRRWNMPSPYYKKKFELEDGSTLLMLFMDTNPFIDGYHGNSEKYPDLAKQDTAAQKKWLIESLSDTDPNIKWKIVVGHHPLYSGGKRKESKDTKAFEAKFAGIFDQYGVQAYICGHEHDLQVIRPKNRFTTQFLTGAGSEVRPTGQRDGTLFAAAEPGFMAFTIAGDTLLVQTIQAKTGATKLLNSISIKSK
ncbi:metallophosphoesterase [Sphingobacterium sp. SG20118]|uniref:metallophosphoesterase n=1 Tax=Sphingobacterium sp. SG20118 TaxID=3367156 RepID=UPI0037DFC654